MEDDIARLIGVVTREISSRMHNGKPARVLVAARDYDTTTKDLWDALTSAERVPKWFLPLTGDLRLGGHYQLVGNAGGEITRCEPPTNLGLTWEMNGDVSWVEIQLRENGKGGASLRLEHVAHVPDEMWDQFGPGAVGIGWDSALMGLGRHISTGASVVPEDIMAWATSAEGKAFIDRSSDGWCAASIAAGADATAARAAAARIAAMYKGEEAPPEA